MIRTIENCLRALLLIWLVVSLLLQVNNGLADNGDFSRIMTHFTSAPLGFESNWPETGELWNRRFFYYWLPYWKLDFPLGLRFWQNNFNSSVIWLWTPGVLLNWLIYSHSVLWLPAIALFPKLLLILFLILVFRWIDTSQLKPRSSLVMSLTLGAPLVLLFTNQDYLAYLNSFYSETAQMIYLLAFLAALIYTRRRLSPWRDVLCLLILFLLATSKASSLYWTFLGLWFIFPLKELFTRPFHYLARYALLAIGLASLAYAFTRPPTWVIQQNAYNSLFNGILVFSKNPSVHLERLQVAQAQQCIGYPVVHRYGAECLQNPELAEAMNFSNVARVVLAEPLALTRMAAHAMDGMQITHLPLGQHAYPVNDLYPDEGTQSRTDLANLWSTFKQKFFPRGLVLVVFLALYLVFFSLNLSRNGLRQELALVGLLVSLAAGLDLLVVILGDGRTEMLKHLFFANYTFDLATLSTFNLLVLVGLNRIDAMGLANPEG